MTSTNFDCPRCSDTGWLEGPGRPCPCRGDDPEQSVLKFCLSVAIPPRYIQSLEAWRPDAYSGTQSVRRAEKIQRIARAFIEHYPKAAEKNKGGYFWSTTCGSGKTFLGCLLLAALSRRHGLRSQFIRAEEIYSRIKRSWDDPAAASEGTIKGGLGAVDLLLIDDIGAGQPTPWKDEVMLEILEHRMGGGRLTFFTANAPMAELAVDARITSRIEAMAASIRFPEHSVRRAESRRETNEIMKIFKDS